MHAAEAGDGGGFHAAHVAVAAATVFLGIAVEKFTPKTGAGRANAVVISWDRGEVADNCDLLATIRGVAQEANDTAFRIIRIDPFEPGRLTVELVQGGLVLVRLIERGKPARECAALWIVEMPRKCIVMSPFFPLPKLAAHE